MISIILKNTKKFMSDILIKDTFDKFYLSEAVIKTSCSYNIDGSINREFYSDDELENLSNDKYNYWQKIRPICFNIIKGNHVPSYMKIILSLPQDIVSQVINLSGCMISPNDINGLFINITYSDGHVRIITGTSLKIFTMDKSLEDKFDNWIMQFLTENMLDFETE